MVEGYLVAHRGTGLVLILLLIAGAGLLVAVDDPLAFVDPDTCEWQAVDEFFDDHSFSELDEFRDAVEAHGADFDEVYGDTAFRERGDTLQFRPDACDLREVPADDR